MQNRQKFLFSLQAAQHYLQCSYVFLFLFWDKTFKHKTIGYNHLQQAVLVLKVMTSPQYWSWKAEQKGKKGKDWQFNVACKC